MAYSIHLINSLEKIIAKSNYQGISPRQTVILIIEYFESLKFREKVELLSSMKGKRPKIDKVARKYASLIGCQPDDIIKFLRDQEYSLTADQINSLGSCSKYVPSLENENETHQMQLKQTQPTLPNGVTSSKDQMT